MPPSQWTLIEPGRHDRDTEEGATRPTKDTRAGLPHLENEEAHNPIDPPTETLHQEGHASNVDKWATSLETARGGRNRKESPLSPTLMKSRQISNPLLYHEPMW